jgi:hypothetical protein
MRIDVFDQTIELATNRSIVLHHARNAEIVCTRGRIWITEDPLGNDIALEAGKSHVVRVNGLAFVTAVSPSAVWLRDPAKDSWGRPRGYLRALAAAARRLLDRSAAAAACATVAANPWGGSTREHPDEGRTSDRRGWTRRFC